jgi:hypothetical protein
VTITRARSPESYALLADRRGRLHVLVPLGPGNRAQEYTAGARTRVFTTSVRLTAAP